MQYLVTFHLFFSLVFTCCFSNTGHQQWRWNNQMRIFRNRRVKQKICIKMYANCPLFWDSHFYIFSDKYLFSYEIVLIINYGLEFLNSNLDGPTCLNKKLLTLYNFQKFFSNLIILLVYIIQKSKKFCFNP